MGITKDDILYNEVIEHIDKSIKKIEKLSRSIEVVNMRLNLLLSKIEQLDNESTDKFIIHPKTLNKIQLLK